MTTIAHLSDLHFGRLDEKVAEILLEELHSQRPDVIVVSGDFTQRARRREFEAARNYVARFPSRPLMVPGNHDVPTFNLLERFIRPTARFRHWLEKERYPRQDHASVSLLGINTARPGGWYTDWSRGRISSEQLSTIQQRFRGHEELGVRILVTHHPFLFPPEQEGRHLVKGPKDTLESLASCGVDLVLAGHFHRAWSDLVATRHPEVPSIVVAQASTSTSTRLKTEPNAYNWIEVDLPSLHITSHEWREGRFASTVSKAYRRDGGGWTRTE
ncbi:MAG: metallophosphoesterase family protein [Verrucomicrobiales bacterium]